jgi:glycosyltransferase involved in cell wall biosynthesis
VKIVIDAMTAEFGGIRTYVDQLVSAWETTFPDDEVHVAVPAGSTIAAEAKRRHELRVRRPSTLGRPVAQTFALRRLVRDTGAEAVLATMPQTTLRRLPCPVAVVVHDLRHQLRPQQFSLARRALRRVSYGRAYAVADGFISVSARTQGDLHELQPATRGRPSVVVHHGADHVRAWPAPDRDGPAIAFAHHTNKNPDLIIEAWEVLAQQGAGHRLTILGVGGAREALQGEIDRRGLQDAITLAPYLPEEEFRRTVSSAAMIVFPSDFEGFGLPVVEGMSLGKPVVIGPDKATIEVAGGHALVMTDWSPTALADAVEVAGQMGSAEVEAARVWGSSFTWARTAQQTREFLTELANSTRP